MKRPYIINHKGSIIPDAWGKRSAALVFVGIVQVSVKVQSMIRGEDWTEPEWSD